MTTLLFRIDCSARHRSTRDVGYSLHAAIYDNALWVGPTAITAHCRLTARPASRPHQACLIFRRYGAHIRLRDRWSRDRRGQRLAVHESQQRRARFHGVRIAELNQLAGIAGLEHEVA